MSTYTETLKLSRHDHQQFKTETGYCKADMHATGKGKCGTIEWKNSGYSNPTKKSTMHMNEMLCFFFYFFEEFSISLSSNTVKE